MEKYKCKCCCNSVIEIKDDSKIPECCGEPMKKVGDDEEDNENRCCCCIN